MTPTTVRCLPNGGKLGVACRKQNDADVSDVYAAKGQPSTAAESAGGPAQTANSTDVDTEDCESEERGVFLALHRMIENITTRYQKE